MEADNTSDSVDTRGPTAVGQSVAEMPPSDERPAWLQAALANAADDPNAAGGDDAEAISLDDDDFSVEHDEQSAAGIAPLPPGKEPDLPADDDPDTTLPDIGALFPEGIRPVIPPVSGLTQGPVVIGEADPDIAESRVENTQPTGIPNPLLVDWSKDAQVESPAADEEPTLQNVSEEVSPAAPRTGLPPEARSTADYPLGFHIPEPGSPEAEAVAAGAKEAKQAAVIAVTGDATAAFADDDDAPSTLEAPVPDWVLKAAAGDGPNGPWGGLAAELAAADEPVSTDAAASKVPGPKAELDTTAPDPAMDLALDPGLVDGALISTSSDPFASKPETPNSGASAPPAAAIQADDGALVAGTVQSTGTPGGDGAAPAHFWWSPDSEGSEVSDDSPEAGTDQPSATQKPDAPGWDAGSIGGAPGVPAEPKGYVRGRTAAWPALVPPAEAAKEPTAAPILSQAAIGAASWVGNDGPTLEEAVPKEIVAQKAKEAAAAVAVGKLDTNIAPVPETVAEAGTEAKPVAAVTDDEADAPGIEIDLDSDTAPAEKHLEYATEAAAARHDSPSAKANAADAKTPGTSKLGAVLTFIALIGVAVGLALFSSGFFDQERRTSRKDVATAKKTGDQVKTKPVDRPPLPVVAKAGVRIPPADAGKTDSLGANTTKDVGAAAVVTAPDTVIDAAAEVAADIAVAVNDVADGGTADSAGPADAVQDLASSDAPQVAAADAGADVAVKSAAQTARDARKAAAAAAKAAKLKAIADKKAAKLKAIADKKAAKLKAIADKKAAKAAKLKAAADKKAAAKAAKLQAVADKKAAKLKAAADKKVVAAALKAMSPADRRAAKKKAAAEKKAARIAAVKAAKQAKLDAAAAKKKAATDKKAAKIAALKAAKQAKRDAVAAKKKAAADKKAAAKAAKLQAKADKLAAALALKALKPADRRAAQKKAAAEKKAAKIAAVKAAKQAKLDAAAAKKQAAAEKRAAKIAAVKAAKQAKLDAAAAKKQAAAEKKAAKIAALKAAKQAKLDAVAAKKKAKADARAAKKAAATEKRAARLAKLRAAKQEKVDAAAARKSAAAAKKAARVAALKAAIQAKRDAAEAKKKASADKKAARIAALVAEKQARLEAFAKINAIAAEKRAARIAAVKQAKADKLAAAAAKVAAAKAKKAAAKQAIADKRAARIAKVKAAKLAKAEAKAAAKAAKVAVGKLTPAEKKAARLATLNAKKAERVAAAEAKKKVAADKKAAKLEAIRVKKAGRLAAAAAKKQASADQVAARKAALTEQAAAAAAKKQAAEEAKKAGKPLVPVPTPAVGTLPARPANAPSASEIAPITFRDVPASKAGLVKAKELLSGAAKVNDLVAWYLRTWAFNKDWANTVAKPMPITFQTCGRKRSAWSSRKGVNVCYELIASFAESFPNYYEGQELEDAVVGASLWVILHTIAHETARRLDVPKGDPSESDVDRVLGIILADRATDPTAARVIPQVQRGLQAMIRISAGKHRDSLLKTQAWRTHQMTSGRLRNVMCLLYAEVPQPWLINRFDLKQPRADRCVGKLKDARKSVGKKLAPYVRVR